MNKKYLVGLICLALAACSSDSRDESKDITLCESGACSDASGDTAYPYIDVDSVIYTVVGDQVIVVMGYLEIPENLQYNSPNIMSDDLEYSWGISFDVDRDNTQANDIAFSITRFKLTDEEVKQGPLIAFTQKNIWQYSAGGDGATVIAEIDAAKDGNVISFSVSRQLDERLKAITTTTPFRITAIANHSGEEYRDSLPDAGYLQAY